MEDRGVALWVIVFRAASMMTRVQILSHHGEKNLGVVTHTYSTIDEGGEETGSELGFAGCQFSSRFSKRFFIKGIR